MMFKKGDRVKISIYSTYYDNTHYNAYNPSNHIGTLIGINNENKTSYSKYSMLCVRWDNGIANYYGEEDLEIVHNKNIFNYII